MEVVDELDYLLPANCPNPYFDTWDRHNSIAFSTATKGLHNAPGENNCFVNSAVQVFWHLDVFRRSYRRLSGHTCMSNSCIFCALKVIFTQFQFSDQSSLHPDALRKALAETFANQQRFQLGHMDDAAECFENILRRIHFHIANNHSEDCCTAPHCLPHQKFSLSILEKVVCPCGASSNPLKFSEMVHYISAKALVSQASVMQKSGDVLHPDRFGLLLRNANAMGDSRDCPGSCGKTVQIQRTLLNSPDVVSIGLVWDSDHPTVETTTEVAKNIGTTILLQDVFHSVMLDVRSLPKLQLVGLVCYYGKHYSTFVFHSKLQVWIYFDDATVREIGPRWEHVVDKCSKGRYQPLLLLYANPNASPVPVETAPKKRTMAPGYGIPGGPEEESSLDRTHESISSHHSYQRSRTPNPEPSHPPELSLHPRARSVTPSASADYPTREDSGSPLKATDHSRQQSFIMAMSSKSDKSKHPLRYGGQASNGGQPGPMTPVGEQYEQEHHHPLHPIRPGSSQDNENYSDYTLSTSNQYRRPSMEGFEPAKLPLTPNMKGYVESSRKESFKKGKEFIRADVVRYQVDSSKPQGAIPPSEYQQYQGSGQGGLYQGQSSQLGSASMFYQGSKHDHFKQRSLSQGDDDAYCSDSSGYDVQSQHTVVKPMANTGHNYDHIDSVSHSHTPVQSGLATLPRKKKEPSTDLSSAHQRQISGNFQSGSSFSKEGSVSSMSSMQDPRATPTNPLGLPPPVPVKSQSSTAMDNSSSSKKLSDTEKKSKKLKKDLKKAEKKKFKETYKSQPDLSAGFQQVPSPANSLNPSAAGGSSKQATDQMAGYIDRRMVENILKHQGLQRQPSTHSTNSQASSSSIESDSIMGRLLASKYSDGSVATDASFDNVSLGSHKDSGYGSSDRNSSSSTGSGTIDPCTQYFLSKSMVVPRGINPQFLQNSSHPHQMVSDFTAPHPQVYSANTNQAEGSSKDMTGKSRDDMTRQLYEALSQRKIMHPIKESSQEDILKILPKEQPSSSTPVRGPSPSVTPSDVLNKDLRPPPIPPKNFAAFQVSKSSHQKEPSIDSLDKDEVKNEYFVSMCEKADDLMDRCILAETQEDLTASLRYCDSALGCLKEAMNQTDISNKALTYAQKKHNSCLLKSRSLFKRSSGYGSSDGNAQGGKRSSITSTDSDNSDKPVGRMASKERHVSSSRNVPRTGHQQAQPQVPSGGVHHQHQMSSHVQHHPQDSTSRKSPLPLAHTSGNASGHSAPSQQFQPQQHPPSAFSHIHPSSGDRASRPRSHLSRLSASEKAETDSVHSRSGSNSSIRSSSSVPCSMSKAHPQTSIGKSQSSGANMSTASSTAAAPVPLDAYGTLPRNRKPRRTSDPTGNSEVYQMFLNRQKNLQGSSSSDSRESDSSSCDGSVQKVKKAEIRELLENNIVQRQLQQFTPSGQGSTSSSSESKHTVVDSRSLQGSRHSYDSAGQRGSTSSNSSINASHISSVGMPGDRQSMTSPRSTTPVTGQYPNPAQHVYSNNHPPSSSSSGPKYNQPPSSTSNMPHLCPQPQSHRQLQQHHSSPPSSTSHNQHQQSYQPHSGYVDPHVTSQIPQPQTVSGYSQPLPGNRPSSLSSTPSPLPKTLPSSLASSQSNMRAITQVTPSSSQIYPRQNLQDQGNLAVRGQDGLDHRQRQNYQSVDSSQSSTNFPAFHQTSTRFSSQQQQPYQQQQQHQQQQQQQQQQQHQNNLSQNMQNLQVNRRNSGGPPPPPPARTTSNPDFRIQQQQQQQHGSQYPQQQHQSRTQQAQFYSTEVGSMTQQRPSNVARVQPNSHLELAKSTIPGQLRFAVCDLPQTQPQSQNQYRHQTQATRGAELGQSQLKHAISSTGLNLVHLSAPAPRPLERCSSQPDCQNLVDSASCSNKSDFLPPSLVASNTQMTSTANTTPESNPSGAPCTLPQTFDDHHYQTTNNCVDDDCEDRPKLNVRDLASKFDKPAEKPALRPKPAVSGITRTRSKSESGSKKPKSALKNKKNKTVKSLKKSVTFAENISSHAAGYESAAELTSFSSKSHVNERAYFSDDEDHFSTKPSAYSDNDVEDVEDSSNSDESPIISEEYACQLCGKREMETGRAYCSKCSFYMNRLVSS